MSTNNLDIGEKNKLYNKYLKEIFDNINYYINKKNQYYQEVYDYSKKFNEIIANDPDLNADKYFLIISKSLVKDNYKLGKYVFPTLKLLIQNNFLLGNTVETKNNTSEFKICDRMINCFTAIDQIFVDNDIWIRSVEVVDEIVHNKLIEVKDKSFQKIYMFYLRVYNKLDGEDYKQGQVKEKLDYFVENSMDNLDLFLGTPNVRNLLNEDNKKSKHKNSDSSDSSDIDNNDCNDNLNAINDLGKYKDNYITTNNLNSSYYLKIYNNLNDDEYITNTTNNKHNPIDLLVCRLVKTIVDTICYRDAKNEIFINNNIINNNFKINIIGLVPKNVDDINNNPFRILRAPDIVNEYAFHSGNFGFCYICRKRAEHYCLETRLPICSYKCKSIIKEEDKQINKMKSNLNKDCPMMLKYFCQILSNKLSTSKEQETALGLITNMFKNYIITMSVSKNFIKVVKEDLCEGLFRTCLSNDIKIFKPSIALFFEVWKYFREKLKRQINSFNENVFLKILMSENSSYEQKKVVLKNFRKRDFKYFVELYANYDCELHERFTVNSIVVSFSNIVQGRYTRTKQSFSEEENLVLINLALKTLTSMLESIFNICYQNFSLKSNLYNNYGGPNDSALNNQKGYPNNKIKEGKVNFDDSLENLNSTNQTTVTYDKIENNMKKKYELQKGIEIFNAEIKDGISFLKKNGLLDKTSTDLEAKDIMIFFRNTPTLKKDSIGEFLGENTELSLKTLKYYSDSFDYKGMHIVQALRIFLSTFRLPAEGQKIDRILENFASKYYSDNPKLFANADCAFYLSYAIMMLQTELHNPNVKDKMNFESFAHILDGQNGGQNLSREYLSDIYKQIQEEPLSLPEWEEEKEKNNNNKAEENYDKERKRIMTEYSSKLKQTKEVTYIILKENDVIGYLSQFMNSIWKPLLTMFSVIIEESNDSSLYTLSINGVSNCVKIFGLMKMEELKNTVMAFLCSMTNLFHIKPLKKKNLMCIKEILKLANSDYRYCKSSWSLVLDLVSKLSYYNVLNILPKEEKEAHFQKRKNNRKSINSVNEMIETEKENVAILSKEIMSNDYEKIFSKTYTFDIISVNEFVKALCDIAMKEFKTKGLNKIFFLQKIVEVADINLLSRPRFNFNNIWKIISDFFVEVGIGEDVEQSMAAIDGLRQLGMKYLQKTESKDYHFQTEFMQPFLKIWDGNKDQTRREYIIFCINNIVRNEVCHIKSGWNIILNIYKSLAQLPENDMVNLMCNQTLETLSKVCMNNISEIVEIFGDFSSCLKLFIKRFPDKMLSIFDSIKNKLDDENNFKLMLSCYKDLILYDDNNIAESSLKQLNNCILTRLNNSSPGLNEIGKKEEFWEFLIEKLLKSIFEELSVKIYSLTDNSIKEKHSKNLQTILINTAIYFNDFFTYNSNELDAFFKALEKIVFYKEEKIQSAGLECIKYLFTIDTINKMSLLQPYVLFLTDLINNSLQKEFMTMEYDSIVRETDLNKNIDVIETNILFSYIQITVLGILEKLLQQFMAVLPEEDLVTIMNCLEPSYNIAIKFNAKIELRFLISRLQHTDNLINLTSQMNQGIKNYYLILNRVYDNNVNCYMKKVEYFKRINESSILILREFLNRNNELINNNSQDYSTNTKNEKENAQREKLIKKFLEPICLYVFPTLEKIEFYKDKKYKDSIVQILLELIMCKHVEIREKVKNILQKIYLNDNK